MEQLNPFVPGQGVLPPFLAGREAEQDLLREHLERLRRGVAPEAFVVLHGPRGNGKTALLEWAERRAESRKIGVIDIDLGDSEDPESEARGRSRLSRWLRAVGGFSVLGTGVNWREVQSGKLTSAIERRGRRGPVLVAIDEAHTMPVTMGRALFTAVQRWQRGRSQGGIWKRRRPQVMLLLAGTPDLPEHLDTMGASFWERSEELPIGRLSREASADAIRIPLAELGRSIAEDALGRIAQERHGYPFFLQLWGKLLWREAGPDCRQLTCADLDRVRPRFEERRNRVYLLRYKELVKADLVEVAAAVSEAFAGAERMPPGPVEQAVRAALERLGAANGGDAVLDVCGRLHDLGYIWTVDYQGRPCYEPGIPSLMRYVARAVASKSEPLPS